MMNPNLRLLPRRLENRLLSLKRASDFARSMSSARREQMQRMLKRGQLSASLNYSLTLWLRSSTNFVLVMTLSVLRWPVMFLTQTACDVRTLYRAAVKRLF